jgi:hypothetical protein
MFILATVPKGGYGRFRKPKGHYPDDIERKSFLKQLQNAIKFLIEKTEILKEQSSAIEVIIAN